MQIVCKLQPVERRYRLKEEKDDTSFDRSNSDPKEAGYVVRVTRRRSHRVDFGGKLQCSAVRAGGRVEGGRKTAELMRDDQGGGGGVAFPPVGFDRGCARREGVVASDIWTGSTSL